MKALIIILIILAVLFVLSLIMYYFNLDMKLSAKIAPKLVKHYDNKKRDKRL